MKQRIMAGVVGALFAAAEATRASAAPASGDSKTPRFCDKDWDDAFEGNGEKIYFRFRDNEVLELDMSKVPEQNYRLLAFHGASQKVGDSFAGVKGNLSEGKANAQATIDLLLNGEWTQEREGGGPRLAELAEAIARIKGVDVEKVRQVVEAATPEERSNWRSNPTVKSTVANLRAEKAAAALEASGPPQEIKINLGQ